MISEKVGSAGSRMKDQNIEKEGNFSENASRNRSQANYP